jgi:AP-3 complex subunit beta
MKPNSRGKKRGKKNHCDEAESSNPEERAAELEAFAGLLVFLTGACAKMSLSDAHYFEEMGVKKYEEIHALLDSREKKDKLEGMKRLMAMISIGRDASNFFPDVVKQVISDSLEVKKLAYQFLTHYAEAKSNEALLCINTFQKDLNDTNQLIRSSALRVLTSIRVPIIAQLQTMAVKQCVRDSSAYVRKAAAHAVAKVYALDPEQSEALEELVQVLLGDSSTMVLGSAVAAFNEVCPHKWELIHPNFRKIVRLCADTDEWGQIMLLNMLTRYGRMFFTKPDKDTDKNPKVLTQFTCFPSTKVQILTQLVSHIAAR